MEGSSTIEGGYDYDFVDALPTTDRLVCKICYLPCRDAQLTECCGHVFCKFCIMRFNSSYAVSHACPMCRVEPFSTFPQREADREIKALKVYCPNKIDGCGWTGELGSIVGHKRPHKRKCKKCDKCDEVIHYTVMKNHETTECPCYCQYCHITAEREVISKQHKEKCHRFPLQCPNNCGMNNILRDNMDEHKKVCPLEMIQCEYHCGGHYCS